MNNKRDCFNNRTKSQTPLLSRADRAVTWRGRGGNTVVRNDQRSNNYHAMNENISGAESRWNSIRNRVRSTRQGSMVPFIDQNLNFQASYHPAPPQSRITTTRAPPPGITPLYNIPCLPSSNSSNIWSSSINFEDYEYHATNRMQALEVPHQQRALYKPSSIVVDSPRSSYYVQGKVYPLLCQEYVKQENDRPSVHEYENRMGCEQGWMPLQSIDSNSRGLNTMNSLVKKKDPRYENKMDMEKINNENADPASSLQSTASSNSVNNKVVTPRSWSQVVSSSATSNKKPTFRKGNESKTEYMRYTSKDIHTLPVAEDSTIDSKITHNYLSPRFTDSQEQLINHCNALNLSASPPIYETGSSSTGVRYLSESLGFAMSSSVRFSEFPEQRPYTVLRATNIPWSISSEDILNLIKNTRGIASPSITELPQSVHIVMDPKIGKTCGEAFVEVIVANKDNLHDLLNRLPIYPVQGRHLRFTESNYDELRNHLFRNWKGTFDHGIATPFKDTDDNDDNGLGPFNNESAFFIGQKDLQGLLNVCRNYKIFYNRKCPERSFEYLMSVVLNIPWLQNRCVRTIQRDILYECYKLVTESLRIHTTKTLHSFDSKLMSRLIRVALTCNGFTVKQKQVILKNSQQKCPIDLMEYIQDPIEPLMLPPPQMNMMNRFLAENN